MVLSIIKKDEIKMMVVFLTYITPTFSFEEDRPYDDDDDDAYYMNKF